MSRHVLALAASAGLALAGAARAEILTLVSAPPGLPEGTQVESPLVVAIDGAPLPSPIPASVTSTESWGYPFDGAAYVSSCPTCGSQLSMCGGDPAFPPGPAAITFVQRFELPALFEAPAIAVRTTNDDAANVYLNDRYVGRVVSFDMPGAPGAFFETVTAADPSWFLAGTNELRYELENYNAPCPLSAAWVATVTFTPVVSVGVDVKPGAFPNTIKLGQGGVVAVAVLGSSAFDPGILDAATATLAGAPVALRGSGEPRASLEDANGDGLLDLVAQFEVAGLAGLPAGDAILEVRAATLDGRVARGYDSARLVP